MKNFRITSIALFMLTTFFYFGCEPQVDVPKPENSILPERFGVDIPGALSSEYAMSNSRVSAVDTLKGNDIYNHLNLFINVGEGAAELVGEIIHGIGIYHINKPMSFSFEGDDDGRTKNLIVEEKPYFDGASWEFVLTITDAQSESEADGGKALQIFWNRYPIKGIAVLKPYNINREEHHEAGEAIFRIDYSETGEQGYESHMIVSIARLPLADPLEEPFSMNSMKMFAGKNGDVIDVYGNSSHPNATFLTGNSGFNWAFVASGSEQSDIGVAEVGLPPSNLDEPGREKLLEYHSIKNVFTREIYEVWPNISQKSVDGFLYNTGAPGYFDEYGFVSGGESPSEAYEDLEHRINLLSPYNPKEISNLEINFK
jgi:hypothetical protein